jgi:putative membrane protein
VMHISFHGRQLGPFGPGRGFLIGRPFNGGPFGGFGLGRLVIMILFLLFIAGVAYLVIRHFDHTQAHHHSHAVSPGVSSDSAAADVLKMRFAKGEIDEDEFTRRMGILRDHQSIS